MANLYKEAMASIAEKIAMQAIRKVIKSGEGTDQEKLDQICTIVSSYMEDKANE